MPFSCRPPCFQKLVNTSVLVLCVCVCLFVIKRMREPGFKWGRIYMFSNVFYAVTVPVPLAEGGEPST